MIAPAFARQLDALGRATTGTTRRRHDPTPWLIALALTLPTIGAAPMWSLALVPTYLACAAAWAVRSTR